MLNGRAAERVEQGWLKLQDPYLQEGPSSQPFTRNYFTISFALVV
jgi:hypothetical protein